MCIGNHIPWNVTPEGIKRIRKSRTKHGAYGAATKAERRAIREAVKEIRALVAELKNAG
jgi:hypothetical protein